MPEIKPNKFKYPIIHRSRFKRHHGGVNDEAVVGNILTFTSHIENQTLEVVANWYHTACLETPSTSARGCQFDTRVVHYAHCNDVTNLVPASIHETKDWLHKCREKGPKQPQSAPLEFSHEKTCLDEFGAKNQITLVVISWVFWGPVVLLSQTIPHSVEIPGSAGFLCFQAGLQLRNLLPFLITVFPTATAWLWAGWSCRWRRTWTGWWVWANTCPFIWAWWFRLRLRLWFRLLRNRCGFCQL